MPNWKKVITSGSNADLNQITGSTLSVVSSSLDYVQVNDTLQGNGAGFQFFAYNEDTSKVKFANWYTDVDNQYGMGMLWYETYFAAIDTDGNADDFNRRIGFYLEQPEAGATDSTSGQTGRHPNNARFYVDVNGGYLSGSLEVEGEITATGDITAYYSSDERLKENIKPIENATDKVNAIGGYTFDWKEDIEEVTSKSGKDVGIIAQELEKVLPELVTTRDNGYKGVDYPKLVALLIQSNKELAARIKKLEQ